MAKFKDRTGFKQGRLLYKSHAYTQNRRVYWNVECDCGTKKIIRAGGQVKSCGCALKEANTGRRLGHKQITDENFIKNSILSVQKSVYKIYSDGDLSFEDFLIICQKKCFYCNKPPSNKSNVYLKKDGTYRKRKRKNKKGKEYSSQMSYRENLDKCYFIYNGLDRIDQKKNHNKDNIVPCCSTCNYMKRDMSRDVFLKKIEEIYKCIRQNS